MNRPLHNNHQKIYQAAEQHVHNLLQDLSIDLKFHDIDHTMAVKDRVLMLARMRGLGEEDQFLLSIAALFHDTGYLKTYKNHEAESIQFFNVFIKDHEISDEEKAAIIRLIEVTREDAKPRTDLEMFIKDADLANLGSERYNKTVEHLRYEWKKFLGQEFSDEEWMKTNLEFFTRSNFYTFEAQQIYGPQRSRNMRRIQKRLGKLPKAKKKLEANIQKNVADSRAAQLIFKTTLRNQIDLTNIADNKANIMLSINAIIITIAMPLLASNLQNNPSLIFPVAILLATCVTAIIYATMVTRPIKMSGVTSQDLVRQGRSNLFFFGNFYKMTYESYLDSMKQVLSNEEELDQSIIRDLYSLGKTLGVKYHQLRICYTIFMTGITLSVIAFAIIYLLN